ncbi:MAG: hypothetical protein PHH26_05550 [Candidatus Thermoplasmatota archaeon]|nr:hypothetical protein [Candidatus Thermoplasmatota archaeon]
MKQFTDKEGRKWEITLTIGAAKRVRDLLEVNLLEPEAGNPPLLTRLTTDEIFLCDVLYCLCMAQATDRGVTDVDFGELLCGDVVLAAHEALYGELLDFFQKRGRTDRATAIRKQLSVFRMSVAKAEVEIGKLDLEAEVENAFGKPSISSPALPESTPTP